MVQNFKRVIIYVAIFQTVFLCSCLTAGTHGYIKIYEYPIAKPILQSAVQSVTEKSQNIKRDTSKAWNDSTKNDYYNDGDNYVSITIKESEFTNSYILKYAGDKNYWDTSKVSQIFIAYAYDKDGNGGSDGNEGIKNSKLKAQLVTLFDNEFIKKLDTILKLTHKTAD